MHQRVAQAALLLRASRPDRDRYQHNPEADEQGGEKKPLQLPSHFPGGIFWEAIRFNF
jgi:hypothetical protein